LKTDLCQDAHEFPEQGLKYNTYW